MSLRHTDKKIVALFSEEYGVCSISIGRPIYFLAYAIVSLFDTCAASRFSDEEIFDILIEQLGETPLNPMTLDGQTALLTLDCFGRAMLGRKNDHP